MASPDRDKPVSGLFQLAIANDFDRDFAVSTAGHFCDETSAVGCVRGVAGLTSLGAGLGRRMGIREGLRGAAGARKKHVELLHAFANAELKSGSYGAMERSGTAACGGVCHTRRTTGSSWPGCAGERGGGKRNAPQILSILSSSFQHSWNRSCAQER